MDTTTYHLAQFNIIKLKDKLDSPMIKEFKSFLAPVNLLAEESPGFIWRLKDTDGQSATNIETPYKDDLIFINLSVWDNLQNLESYIYHTVHSYFLKNRNKWGVNMKENQSVLWWIPKGEKPTAFQGKERLDLLNKIGPSANAFSFREKYDHKGFKE
ncbi:DUF3291 domain-containing protein [Aquimarina sp. 2201CG1-2-11]|uniref:DUF3291 domain-containing protein n=1 Tax=Aquimarina discodermiae TaxID=3231043 RepID=UPI003461D782